MSAIGDIAIAFKASDIVKSRVPGTRVESRLGGRLVFYGIFVASIVDVSLLLVEEEGYRILRMSEQHDSAEKPICVQKMRSLEHPNIALAL